MWLIIAILFTVPYATSSSRVKLTLNASNPKVTFQTPNYPRRHIARQKYSWLISAPGNVDSLDVSCNISIVRSCLCSFASFYFYNYNDKITLCGTKQVQRTINGSTSLFVFKSAICVNLFHKGVSCVVSYNPEDIPTCTTPVDPSCMCGQKLEKKIAGGNYTKPNEYPWQAILMNRSYGCLICGGSLIATQWVLSSSHCVNQKSPSSILVVLGAHDFENPSLLGENFEVIEIIVHEKFEQVSTGDNDIALIKLDRDSDQVLSPICLPFNYKYYDFTDQTGITTGWGRTIPDEEGSDSMVLKEIHQKIIMYSKCTWLDGYGWEQYKIKENMICALAQHGGPQDGDSGGPMVWKSDSSNLYFQLGITSFENLFNQGDPAVYTKVSHFVDWIVAKTGAGEEFCVKI